MAAALHRSGRASDTVVLVAVTKTVDVERILAACDAGIRDFGENYIQESLLKIDDTALKLRELNWHFIGHLQSNKAKEAVGRFKLIQSVDSNSLAIELSRQALRTGQPIDILMEVKLDPSTTKFGVDANQAIELAEHISDIPGVKLKGLMGMAPFSANPEDARPYFRDLYQLFIQLPQSQRMTLSMGMSGDFETAIEEGATLVRIGTALFGNRNTSPKG